MTTLPPEIELMVLDAALTDWLEQPSLRAVCTTWRSYIDNSPAAFAARYEPLVVLGGIDHPYKVRQFHRVLSYRKRLFQSKAAPYKLLPCTVQEDGNGKVVKKLPEINISIYFNDPLIKPADCRAYPRVVTPICGADFSFTHFSGRSKVESNWNPGDGTVGSFLERFKIHVDSILDVDELEGRYEETRFYQVPFSLDETFYNKDGYGLAMIIWPLTILRPPEEPANASKPEESGVSAQPQAPRSEAGAEGASNQGGSGGSNSYTVLPISASSASASIHVRASWS
ncbi:hypothetical protein TWF225_005542 [Orbilia oligospora]|nr:hypothetical protein TWF225_005542 [Orbilia oligospora]KAF3270866.1 hypothetical protein TWF217_007140 [Orbilia oligospora]